MTVELVPAVGEFIAARQVLLRVHGEGPVDEALLGRAVRVSDDRTIEQDPAFAIRVIVDTAIRALSPAINDPTTAVHALDALEVMVRDLAARDLEASVARDEQRRGAGGVAYRGLAGATELAFGEIRSYGSGSVQVCRRMCALLGDLRAATPAVRHAAIDEHLERLRVTITFAYPTGSAEKAVAEGADRTGLGLERGS